MNIYIHVSEVQIVYILTETFHQDFSYIIKCLQNFNNLSEYSRSFACSILVFHRKWSSLKLFAGFYLWKLFSKDNISHNTNLLFSQLQAEYPVHTVRLKYITFILFCSGNVGDGYGGIMVCYFPYWAKYRPNPYYFLPKHVPPEYCTHVIWCFITIKNNLPLEATKEEKSKCGLWNMVILFFFLQIWVFLYVNSFNDDDAHNYVQDTFIRTTKLSGK